MCEEIRGRLSVGVILCAGLITSCASQRTPNEANLRTSFVEQIARVEAVSEVIIGDGGFQFVHPNTDGEPVTWRVAFQTIILVPPSSNNGVYHGEVESAWYADGELVEPVGSMSRLPNSFLEVGIAQQCYAIWFEEEQRWDW